MLAEITKVSPAKFLIFNVAGEFCLLSEVAGIILQFEPFKGLDVDPVTNLRSDDLTEAAEEIMYSNFICLPGIIRFNLNTGVYVPYEWASRVIRLVQQKGVYEIRTVDKMFKAYDENGVLVDMGGL